jgi:hypothetical protein
MVANSVARHLRRAGYEAAAAHRDVGKTKRRRAEAKKERGGREVNPDAGRGRRRTNA